MSKSKYSRTDFYDKNLINGISENDLITNGFQDFKFTYEHSFYSLKATDIRRFDLLSIRFYRTDKFWWILAKVNFVDDIWNDYKIGDIMKIPDKRDIEEFYIKLVKKNK